MEELGHGPASKNLSFKDKMLVGGRMFRLLTGDVLGLVSDAMTVTDINEEGLAETDILQRAELRTGAIEANISSYQLEKKMGSEEHRQRVERSFLEEFSLDC